MLLGYAGKLALLTGLKRVVVTDCYTSGIEMIQRFHQLHVRSDIEVDFELYVCSWN
jgi:hypothetical protein